MKDFPTLYDEKMLDNMYHILYDKYKVSKETEKLLYKYFSAINNFYEILPLNEAYNIITTQNPDLISKDAFLHFCEILRHGDQTEFLILSEDECFTDGEESNPFHRFICHASLWDYDGTEFYELFEEQYGKPIYIPAKDKLLKYTDEFYLDQTPWVKNMKDFLFSVIHDKNKASDYTEDFVWLLTEGDQDYRLCTERFELITKNNAKEYSNKFFECLYDLESNTRMPMHRGHTPKEMELLTGNVPVTHDNIPLFTTAYQASDKAEKNERNAPCPCGSGKKYKKCCRK